MGALTKVGQETAIGEGLALGCLRLGVVGVSADEPAVDAAFAHAWRNWSEAQFFDSVNAAADRNDISRILDRSERRRHAIYAAWSCGPTLRPYVRDWTLDEVAAGLLETTLVTGDQWEELARDFTAQLGDEHVVRAG